MFEITDPCCTSDLLALQCVPPFLSVLLFLPAHSLEEASETLNGHTLKLRCLEGLWRQAGSKEAYEKGAERPAASGDSNSSSASGEKGSGRNSDELSQSVSGLKPVPVSEEGRPLASTAPALRAGLSGLLKRLGSTPLSYSQKEVRLREKTNSLTQAGGETD